LANSISSAASAAVNQEVDAFCLPASDVVSAAAGLETLRATDDRAHWRLH
jgi:hypothetical protein